MKPERAGPCIILSLKSILAFLILASASPSGGQTLQTLASFATTNGASPLAGLTLGDDGNFYGMTTEGGVSGVGTVFKVTTNGTLTTLVSFQGTNGANPQGGLTLNNDGNFYGTTVTGGSADGGTVFKVTTNGTLTTLVSFVGTNGLHPRAGLTLGNDGNFYGTTADGGDSDAGTVFNMTTNGTLTTLVSFQVTNGANPFAILTPGNDGNFYGTTTSGGSGGDGTVFKVTTNGGLTALVSFSGGNGMIPLALTLGNDGNFYGMTELGGDRGAGTMFKVTTNGGLTTLLSFFYNNGATPLSALTLLNDGTFCGTTYEGGDSNVGTVFKVTTNGTLTTLVSFAGGNGANPSAGLTPGSGGNLYGTTAKGGIGNVGTVFCLLPTPIITVQPQSQIANAGAPVTFFVGAISVYALSYQWQKNGTNLPSGGNVLGATSNPLTLTNISDSDAADYSVVVSNPYLHATSSNATLTVDDFPFLASPPQSQTVIIGSNVTFAVTVYGAPPFVFQWYFNGTPLGSPTAGTHFSSYTLTQVGTNRAGNYSVQAVNGLGSLTSSDATLTVIDRPGITLQPVNTTNNADTTATFSVVVASLSPVSYQWQKNGMGFTNGGNISGITTSTMTITNVSDNDAAIYSVIVTNLAGSTTSSNATLTVLDPPGITAQPVGLRLLLGRSVAFNISVSGTAPLHYQWRFNDDNVLNATNAAYAIQSVAATNTGNYSVVVTNGAGSTTSSNALLTVLVPPTLALQIWAGYPLLYLDGMLSNNFVVQYSTNLAGTNWMDLLSLSNLSVSPYLFIDSAGDSQPARFYRAFMQ